MKDLKSIKIALLKQNNNLVKKKFLCYICPQSFCEWDLFKK